MCLFMHCNVFLAGAVLSKDTVSCPFLLSKRFRELQFAGMASEETYFVMVSSNF